MRFLSTIINYDENENIDFNYIKGYIQSIYVFSPVEVPKRDNFLLIIYANNKMYKNTIKLLEDLKNIEIPYKENFDDIVETHFVMASNKKYENNDIEMCIELDSDFNNPKLKYVSMSECVKTTDKDKFVVNVYYTKEEHSIFDKIKSIFKHFKFIKSKK